MEDKLNVTITVEVTDAQLEQLKAVSPRYQFVRKVARTGNEIAADVWATTDILLTSFALPAPEAAPRLRWVQSISAGVDHLLALPLAEDIIVTSASGIHATPIAEYVFAMILAFARKIPLMMKQAQKAEWHADRFNFFMPRELRHSTLGILGYGNIGREVARIAKAFGMEVLATKRDVKNPKQGNTFLQAGVGDPDASLVDRLYPPEATRSMVALCDFVVVLIPQTHDTLKFVSAEIIAAMKKTAILINVARGAVVDEEALIKALTAHEIGGAALDVFVQEPLPANSPLWKLDNVILSPHLAGNTDHYQDSANAVFIENLGRYILNQDMINRVDRKRGY